MDRSVLIMGQTDKRDAKYVGRHGEGMKVAAAVLLRNGHTFSITTGREKWVASLEATYEYCGAESVVWNIFESDNGLFYNGVTYDIGNVARSDYDLARSRCLAFIKGAEDSAIAVGYGDRRILTHDACRGKLFSHGIFICDLREVSDVKWAYGYDIDALDLNTDRDLPHSWDINYALRRTLLDAISGKQMSADQVFDLLFPISADGRRGRVTGEARAFSEISSSYAESATKSLTEVFRKRYGKDTRPYEDGKLTDQDICVLGAMGVKVQAVPAALWRVLKLEYAEPMELLKEDKPLVTPTDKPMSAMLHEVVELVRGVEYQSFNIGLGRFSAEGAAVGLRIGNEIFVAEELDDRQDFVELLTTVVHEVSHRYGPDLSHGHVEAISRISSQVSQTLLRQRNRARSELADAIDKA